MFSPPHSMLFSSSVILLLTSLIYSLPLSIATFSPGCKTAPIHIWRRTSHNQTYTGSFHCHICWDGKGAIYRYTGKTNWLTSGKQTFLFHMWLINKALVLWWINALHCIALHLNCTDFLLGQCNTALCNLDLTTSRAAKTELRKAKKWLWCSKIEYEEAEWEE